MTHDNEFVASRINAKIYWIKKYNGQKWEYEKLPTSDQLPQSLIVSLVGCRQPILFCESENEEKYDASFFKLMFPEFKVIPSGGCTKVISKVKAYKATKLPQKAFGIIDCDYRKEDFLDGQKKHNIYYFPFFEIENFLFCQEILTQMIEKYSKDKTSTFENIIAAVKADFVSNKERFIVRNVAHRLREIGYPGKINALNSREELQTNYIEYCSTINLATLFDEYEQKFNSVAESNDLNSILRYLDLKNLLNKYDSIFNFENDIKYSEEVLEFFKSNPNLVKSLRTKFLNDIVNCN